MKRRWDRSQWIFSSTLQYSKQSRYCNKCLHGISNSKRLFYTISFIIGTYTLQKNFPLWKASNFASPTPRSLPPSYPSIMNLPLHQKVNSTIALLGLYWVERVPKRYLHSWEWSIILGWCPWQPSKAHHKSHVSLMKPRNYNTEKMLSRAYV